LKKTITILCSVLFAFLLQGCTAQQGSTVDPYAYTANQIANSVENAETEKVLANDVKASVVEKTDQVVEEVSTYDLIIACETGYWWATDNAKAQCSSYDNNVILIKNHNQASITYVNALVFQTNLTKQELNESINKFRLDKQKCIFNILDL
jgi:uncharacterized membrane protein